MDVEKVEETEAPNTSPEVSTPPVADSSAPPKSAAALDVGRVPRDEGTARRNLRLFYALRKTVDSQRWILVGYFLILAIAVLMALFRANGGRLPSTASDLLSIDWDVWEPILAIMTLATAVLVWVAEAQESWATGLPTYLTLSLWHESQNNEVLRVDHARVVDGDAPRPYAQQLAAQMVGDRLNFNPMFRVVSNQVVLYADPEHPQRKRKFIRHLQLVGELLSLPDALQGETNLPRIATADDGWQAFKCQAQVPRSI